METDRSEHKIGIFGGSFDPIHIGHLIIAEASRQQFGLEKVIFIPAKIPPHKNIPVAADFHRLKMVELAIENNPCFEVSDVEIRRNSVSYTYETIAELKKKISGKLFLIVGWDTFLLLPSWYKAEELVREVSFIVAPRIVEKEDIPEFPFEVRFARLDCPRIEISSSRIRQNIKKGISVRYLVAEKVLYYLMQEKIYG